MNTFNLLTNVNQSDCSHSNQNTKQAHFPVYFPLICLIFIWLVIMLVQYVTKQLKTEKDLIFAQP